MTSVESWLLSYLLNALWQVPLLFAAGWVAARLARSAGPSLEHRVWTGTLLLQVLLPLCRFHFEDVWQIAERLAFWSGHDLARNGEVRVLIGAGTASGSTVLQLRPAVLAALAAVYGSCLLYCAGRLLWGLWRTATLRREAQPLALTGNARQKLEGSARRLGVKSDSVWIGTSRAIAGPLTLGIRAQALLLPPHFLQTAATDDLHAALAHELAHIRRRDFAKNLLHEILSLPIAWHPLLWLTRSRLAETREMVCDAMAADKVLGRERYAHALLRLARMQFDRAAPRTLHAIGIFDANIFERRVMNLSQGRVERKGARRAAIVAACGVLAVAACGSALALRIDVAPPAKYSMALAAGSSAPKRVHVKAENLTPIKKTTPVYPAKAKEDGNTIDGDVLLDVIIGADGSPESIVVSKSLREDYDASAQEAVRQWQWQPFLLNGDPVEVETTITITYSMKP
jgi:TonB family protein